MSWREEGVKVGRLSMGATLPLVLQSVVCGQNQDSLPMFAVTTSYLHPQRRDECAKAFVLILEATFISAMVLCLWIVCFEQHLVSSGKCTPPPSLLL